MKSDDPLALVIATFQNGTEVVSVKDISQVRLRISCLALSLELNMSVRRQTKGR
jgi:hypothetical protein